MPRVSDDHLLELRQRYNATYTAHQGCVRALMDAGPTAEARSKTMLACEAKALSELIAARAKLLDALGSND